MAAIAFSALTNLLKYQYPHGLEEAIYMQSPLLGRMPKGKLIGTAISQKIKHSPGQKASSLFATIQAGAVAAGGFSASLVSEFLISAHFNNYAVFQLETAAISRSEGNAAGVRSYVKTETDSALEDLGIQLTQALYGNGGGAIGRVGSVVTTELTLATLEDVVNFEPGQVIDWDTTDGTSGAVGGDPTVITAVNRETGVLTAGANWAAGFTVAGRYLFRAGNFGIQVPGLGAWIPASAPGATLFNNVNRSVDPVRLGGNRYVTSGSDGTYLRAISNALSRTQRAVKGARPTELFVNPFVFDRIIQEMNDRTDFVTMPGKSTPGSALSATFGYKAIKIAVGDADCMLYKDIHCQRDIGWLLQMDTWEILPVPGGFPRTLEGGDGLTVSNADASEFRFAAYWNILGRNPGKNCRIDFSYLNGI